MNYYQKVGYMEVKNNRKRQRLFRYAVDTFVELLEQVTKRRVNYKCNNSDTACWNNFMDTFSDLIGEEFVRKFANMVFNLGLIQEQRRTIHEK